MEDLNASNRELVRQRVNRIVDTTFYIRHNRGPHLSFFFFNKMKSREMSHYCAKSSTEVNPIISEVRWAGRPNLKGIG